MDTINICDGIKAGELLVAHLLAVRRIPGFERARGIVCVESNMFGAAVQMTQFVSASDINNISFIRDDMVAGTNGEEIRPGSRTMHENKVLACEMLMNLIERRVLRIHVHFTSGMPERSMYDNMLGEFFRQLRGFMRVVTPSSTDPTKRPTIKYTGKLTGKDDMVMTAALGVYHYNSYMVDARFAVQRNAR